MTKYATVKGKMGPPTRKQNARALRRRRRKALRRARGPAPTAGARFGGTIRTGDQDQANFRQALLYPFSPSAIGARVPDSYAMPSVAYHLRTQVSLTNSAQGALIGAFYPSPCLTLQLPTGTQTGLATFTQNTNVHYLTSPSTLATALTEYRTVAWGIKFVPKNTYSSVKGKIVLAVVPTTNNAPSWNTLETVTATDNDVIGEYICGIKFTGNYATTWTNLPSARCFSATELLDKEVQVVGVPMTAGFYDYKGTTDRSVLPWAAGQVLADEGVFNNTTGLVNATAGGRKDVASVRGGSAILFYLSGGNASVNDFDVDIIYHLEGTPNLTASTGAQMTPSSLRVEHGSTQTVEKALSVAHAAVNVVRTVAAPSSNAAAIGGALMRAAISRSMQPHIPRLL